MPKNKLEIVLKCDTSGCVGAVTGALTSLNTSHAEITVFDSGVGAVNKSDIFMAETGSRLIVGFNVSIAPHLDRIVAEHNVEVRLYEVIYKLLDDLKAIAESFGTEKAEDEIIGSARVIALFKSSRKGIILGCEIGEGKLIQGHQFRILGAMGQIYTGKIESLHIENHAVREAVKGQKAGLKISDFNKVAIGDIVESFKTASKQNAKPWQPQGRIFYPQA